MKMLRFMRLPAGCMLMLMAGVGLAAETYRWVDEKGVVNYGEKPPANRPATPVDTHPRAIIESGYLERRKTGAESERSVQESTRSPILAPAPAPSSVPVRGMEFDVYIRLQRGMTEGELLLRAGRPDHHSVDNLFDDILKTYYYFPTSANPYTTVVSLRGGRISEIERIKKF